MSSLSLFAVVLVIGMLEAPTTAFVPHPSISISNKASLLLATRQEQQQQADAARRQPVNSEDVSTEEAFLDQCKRLCDERNLRLQKVKNARDLATVANSPIQPNRIYRMGRVSDATADDIALLLNEDDDTGSSIGLRTLVDLRSPTELKDDPTLLREAVFSNFTDIVWKEQGRNNEGCLRLVEKGKGPIKHKSFWNKYSYERNDNKEEITSIVIDGIISPEHPVAYDETDDQLLNDMDDDEGEECLSLDCPNDVSIPTRKERHFVSLMNEFKYVKGTVSKLRKRDITKAILKSPGAVVSRRMRASLKKPFLDEINDGGLPMLNELLLRFGAPGIKYVLELCADADRHPIAFYCTAGKDRTGAIAAIILALCGCQPQDIVEDYTLSANVYAEMNDHQAMVGALSQRNLDPKTFLGAPASVMRDTLESINENYGSVEGYCNWIGFGPEKQERLRQACMLPKDEIKRKKSRFDYEI